MNHATGQSYPFYPIPVQAITEPFWIEGGPAGNSGAGGDRHMLIVDRDNRHLYELFALRWTGARWEAGSGAFFDLNTNGRRPEGWTSADAAGLAILPGLVRYDEVFGPDEIRHALRVTVHGVNNYVWPASHRANTNASGPPLGARLRLKPGTNISGYPPYIQKIFRAMKTYGLIVADTGSDMYVSGVFDTRWSNDQLNPAFRAIKASDFEFIQLGWRGDSAPCTMPGAPTGLTGTGSGLVASFNWTAPATGGAVTDYLLEAGNTSGAANLATVSVPASATTFAASAAAGTYYVRVRARNACGSVASNEVMVTLSNACTLPGAPGPASATVNGSTVGVTWPPAAGATTHLFEAGLLPGQATLVNSVVNGIDAHRAGASWRVLRPDARPQCMRDRPGLAGDHDRGRVRGARNCFAARLYSQRAAGDADLERVDRRHGLRAGGRHVERRLERDHRSDRVDFAVGDGAAQHLLRPGASEKRVRFRRLLERGVVHGELRSGTEPGTRPKTQDPGPKTRPLTTQSRGRPSARPSRPSSRRSSGR